MNEYNYGSLSSREFEKLACDVLTIRENKDFELFVPFSDFGMDARNENSRSKIVVQAKICNYSLDKLVNKLEKEELPKVKKLNPSRYILVLSCPLTVGIKDEIFNLFEGYIKYKKDIVTKDDLDKYFRSHKYEEVLNNYPSLWMPRVSKLKEVLKKEINKSVINRTLCYFDDVVKIKKYFVKTRRYEDALNYLYNRHCILITGDPGSGKTTNAMMLALEFYETKCLDEIYIVQNIEEIYQVYEQNKKQIFILDDFWGSTFDFSKRKVNEEKDLLQIIDKFEESNNHYLVLTSREYVLEQMIKKYPELKIKNYKERIFYKLEDYTDSEKAEILFRHAYNSNLNEDLKRGLFYNVKNIISFPNYSPRLISDYIKNNKHLKSKDFFDNLFTYLRDPREYFEQIFNKLSLGAQMMGLILAISNPPVLIKDLETSFKSVCKSINDVKLSEFQSYIEELENSFTITYVDDDYNLINFRNYSIHDFINDKMKELFCDYEDYFIDGVCFYNQLYNLCYDNTLNLNKTSLERITNRMMLEFDKIKYCNYESEEFHYYINHTPADFHIDKIRDLINVYKYNEDIKDFVQLRVELLYSKFDHCKIYKITEFENLPWILRLAYDIGCRFDMEKICEIYILNCHFLSDIYWMTSFPKEYLNYIKEIFKAKNEIDTDYNIIERIDYDINELYRRDLEMEASVIIDEIKSILDIMGIKYTKEIKEKLDEYKIDMSSPTIEETKHHRRTSEEKILDEVIEDSSKWLFNDYDANMTENKFKKILNKRNLSKHQKQLMLDNIDVDGLFYLLELSHSNYINLVIDYLISNNLDTLDMRNLSYILDYAVKKIKDKKIKEKLYKFAYDYISRENYNFLLENVINDYNINEKDLNTLICNGILIKYNKWIHFSDVTLTYYLISMYLKKLENKTNLDYEKVLYTRKHCINFIYILEKFDTENVNNLFLKPNIEKIYFKDGRLDLLGFVKLFGNLTYELKNEIVYFEKFVSFIYLLMDIYIPEPLQISIHEIIEDNKLFDKYKTIKDDICRYDIHAFLSDEKNSKYNEYKNIYNMFKKIYGFLLFIYNLIVKTEGKRNVFTYDGKMF